MTVRRYGRQPRSGKPESALLDGRLSFSLMGGDIPYPVTSEEYTSRRSVRRTSLSGAPIASVAF